MLRQLVDITLAGNAWGVYDLISLQKLREVIKFEDHLTGNPGLLCPT